MKYFILKWKRWVSLLWSRALCCLTGTEKNCHFTRGKVKDMLIKAFDVGTAIMS